MVRALWPLNVPCVLSMYAMPCVFLAVKYRCMPCMIYAMCFSCCEIPMYAMCFSWCEIPMYAMYFLVVKCRCMPCMLCHVFSCGKTLEDIKYLLIISTIFFTSSLKYIVWLMSLDSYHVCYAMYFLVVKCRCMPRLCMWCCLAMNWLPYTHEINWHVMNVLGALHAMDVLTGVLQYAYMMFN